MSIMSKSIKFKILIPVSLILLLLVVTYVAYMSIRVSLLVDDFKDDRMNAAVQSVTAHLSALQHHTRAAAVAMGGNAELIRLIDSGDRFAVWQFLYGQKDYLGVSEIIVADHNGITIARSHMRDSFGDDVSGVPSIAAGLRRELLSLYTPTPTAEMVMTTASPILYMDRLVGSVVVNFVVGTDEFVDQMREIFDADFTVFRGDLSVASTLIHPETGNRAVGTNAAPHISAQVIERGENMRIDLNIFGMLPYDAYYFPLLGVDGNPVGMFFIGIPQAYADNIVNLVRTTMIIMGVVGLAISIFAVLRIANSVSKPLHQISEFMEGTALDGDIVWKDHELDVVNKYIERPDEVGKIYSSYKGIINCFIEINDELKKVASGNLDFDVHVRSEYDLISQTLKQLVEDLSAMFAEMNAASEQVAADSGSIADGSQNLAQSSTQQASTVQELSVSAASIAERTKENAQMATTAARLAGVIKENAEKGSLQMDEMVTAVNEITRASQSINKIIKVIDDIAFQTNILALNAAVEAARAGQHGKGFAVVAEEVRTLAAKSAEAAKDTGALISDSIEKAAVGAKIATETADSLAEIVSGINESTLVISEIAHASETQAEGIASINSGIDQISSVVQHNSATSEESAASAQELNMQAAKLKSLIAQFKFKNATAITDGSPGGSNTYHGDFHSGNHDKKY